MKPQKQLAQKDKVECIKHCAYNVIIVVKVTQCDMGFVQTQSIAITKESTIPPSQSKSKGLPDDYFQQGGLPSKVCRTLDIYIKNAEED